jgi:hypothetical protein
MNGGRHVIQPGHYDRSRSQRHHDGAGIRCRNSGYQRILGVWQGEAVGIHRLPGKAPGEYQGYIAFAC